MAWLEGFYIVISGAVTQRWAGHMATELQRTATTVNVRLVVAVTANRSPIEVPVKPTRQWSLQTCILVPRLARIQCGCGQEPQMLLSLLSKRVGQILLSRESWGAAGPSTATDSTTPFFSKD
ncbi:predicted protein [Chaetomium globosum CBS 148.51]|uniref:Uncharacterized protein n=1 Tax=Chaetomium globosum (strain ATCC 6205 / CBS 148.51 / DSM 1962 / NBRC 6347 / NRRL 1970) TaxID=306901 RepID=Q2GUF1_CHAGB|nr:uncharacterized protein CHGG_08403 [Chaetomium globosum CBS 148.51]EAQ84389.1 predicted protein [Chaetomium globosum CBS 148.51]